MLATSATFRTIDDTPLPPSLPDVANGTRERGPRLPSHGPLLYSLAMPKRFQIRPPGLKPTTKVGTLGPYRGRLGLAWVIAPIVAGLVIVIAAYFALFR